MKISYICPLCSKELPITLNILEHCQTEHAEIFQRYPNPLCPRENLVFKVD